MGRAGRNTGDAIELRLGRDIVAAGTVDDNGFKSVTICRAANILRKAIRSKKLRMRAGFRIDQIVASDRNMVARNRG